jgi:hypothetical protein
MCNKPSKVLLVVGNMNLNKFFQIKENQAMRQRYGTWIMSLMAVCLVFLSVSTASAQLIKPKFYPVLELQNRAAYPPTDQAPNVPGPILIPGPSAGGDRYFLIPVFIYNEVDPAFNPNIGGQKLEPIRSFEFQFSYVAQAMTLDDNPAHGPAVVTVGPSLDPATQEGLAKNFYIRYKDVLAPGDSNPNPFRHIIRITAASEVDLNTTRVGDPIPGTNQTYQDTSVTPVVLLWVRFKVLPNAVQSGIIALDTSKFNDHYGDSLPNATSYKRGNIAWNAPSATVTISPQPGFDFRPFSQILSMDNLNFKLLTDLIYDPTLGTSNPSVGVQLRNAIGNSRLTNISICTDEPWLLVSSPNPGGGQHCISIARIDYSSSFGSEEKDLFISANPGSLPPGIYFGTVTLTSDGAFNSPAKIFVRLIVRRRPNEPTSAGGTGIRLTLTNSCLPQCSSTIVFGTGPGATAGIDPLYGETIFSMNDRTLHDTNVVASQRCWAYFAPLDVNADPAFGDPTFLGTLRDIRSEKTDTTILYKVVFSAGSGATNCYPVTVCVDPGDFPAGGRIVARDTLNGSQFSVDLRSATEVGNQRCFTIRDPRITSFIIEYTPGTIGTVPSFKANGWNLVSLPVIPPFMHADSIFRGRAGGPFAYRADIGWTIPLSGLLEFGRGYMVKYGSYIPKSDSVIAGIRSRVINNVRIDQGWNTIGSLSVPTSVVGISFTPLPNSTTNPQQISDVFEYVTGRGYRQVSFIIPGKGYFVKTDSAGYYSLIVVDGKKTANLSEQLMQQLGKVLVSDAADNQQDLYFGSSNVAVNAARFELPPTNFDMDARFASNKGYIEFNKSSYNVAIKSKSYPVSLEFSNVQGEVVVTDMNGNLLGTAVNGGSVTIANENIKNVQIAMKQSSNAVNASGYALEQNYPNPFNPSTSIFYTVPAASEVTLVVYNELGQIVKTLVAATVDAGRHEVRFDASELSSGNYVYTLRAGSFTQSFKMTLSK